MEGYTPEGMATRIVALAAELDSVRDALDRERAEVRRTTRAVGQLAETVRKCFEETTGSGVERATLRDDLMRLRETVHSLEVKLHETEANLRALGVRVRKPAKPAKPAASKAPVSKPRRCG